MRATRPDPQLASRSNARAFPRTSRHCSCAPQDSPALSLPPSVSRSHFPALSVWMSVPLPQNRLVPPVLDKRTTLGTASSPRPQSHFRSTTWYQQSPISVPLGVFPNLDNTLSTTFTSWATWYDQFPTSGLNPDFSTGAYSYHHPQTSILDVP
eukprot:2661222-Rhodomonas_salina.1